MKTINRNRFNRLISLLNAGNNQQALVELNRKERKGNGYPIDYHLCHTYAIPKDSDCKHYVYEKFYLPLDPTTVMFNVLGHGWLNGNGSLIAEISKDRTIVAKKFFEYTLQFENNDETLDCSRHIQFIEKCLELLQHTNSFYLVIKSNHRWNTIELNRYKALNGIRPLKRSRKRTTSNFPLVVRKGQEISGAREMFDLAITPQFFPSMTGLSLTQIKRRIETGNMPPDELELLIQLADCYSSDGDYWDEKFSKKYEFVKNIPVKPKVTLTAKNSISI